MKKVAQIFGQILLQILIFALVSPEFAFALKKTGSRSVRIRVLSYNIKGLPALINPSYDVARYGEIGKILAARKAKGTAPDIVLLQESFDAPTVDLRRAAGYPHEAVGPSSTKVINSGLFILSDFPIVAKASILYRDNDCATWDCFASKGAQMARVQIPGVPFALTLVNTHTQSGKKYEVPREAQLQDLSIFLRDVLPTNEASIIGGDFNTSPSLPSFARFEKATGLTSVGRVCLTPNSGCVVGEGTDRSMILAGTVDHFFIQPGTVLQVKPLVVGRTFAKPVNGRMLSDHLGYEAIYELSW